MTDFAPSEEFSLLCDVEGCEAALSMVADVARVEHGWGRVTLYDSTEKLPWGDYDLCQQHYRAVQDVLEGKT